LFERPELIVVLIDARHGLKDFDNQFLEWAKHHKKQILLVLTKADKLSRTEKDRLSRSLNSSLDNYEWLFSEINDAKGIQYLQKKIEQLCL
jgi:GTP-binding protein EngB required for normal cell division